MAGSDDWSLKLCIFGMAERRTFSMFYNRRPFLRAWSCHCSETCTTNLARGRTSTFLNFFQYWRVSVIIVIILSGRNYVVWRSSFTRRGTWIIIMLERHLFDKMWKIVSEPISTSFLSQPDRSWRKPRRQYGVRDFDVNAAFWMSFSPNWAAWTRQVGNNLTLEKPSKWSLLDV